MRRTLLGGALGAAIILTSTSTGSTAPPRLAAALLLQHAAVDLGGSNNFTVTVTGDEPLAYQWRLDGTDLADATNRSLVLNPARESDEGDYTVVVTNAYGSITSSPVRLWVTPVATNLVKGYFTNSTGVRLPYFYILPAGYDPGKNYPLMCYLHGRPGDETMIYTGVPGIPGYVGYGNMPPAKVLVSYKQQARDPLIMIWPTRRAGEANGDWTPQYLELIWGCLDKFVAEHSVDTNRIYLDGYSQGMHGVWDLLGQRPNYFAAARMAAGWNGAATAATIRNVPMWFWAASDDSLVAGTREALKLLRFAGGNPIYTEYTSGDHLGGIGMGCCTPANVEWLLAQRRGEVCTNQIRVDITGPSCQATATTGATNVVLSGTACALGDSVISVVCTNLLTKAGASVSGTTNWTVPNVRLVPKQANLVQVMGVTTSWAPAFGGNTTFSDTIVITSSPVMAALHRQAGNTVLEWSGGVPPFAVEQTEALGTGGWITVETNAVSPILLPQAGAAGFYRVLSQ